MQAIGTYREIWAQTPDGPRYHDRPVYAIRQNEPHQNGATLEVEVFTMGRWCWIKARPEDITVAAR